MGDKKSLHILWTNADPETTQFMVMMYATNGMVHGWWDEVTVIIWGATAKLVSNSETVQDLIKTAQHAGVKFSACVACARQLGVAEKLEALDIEVIPWGEKLTELLKTHEFLLTI